MFAGGGARREVAAETPAAEDDLLRIDLRKAQGEVDDRRDHGFPVGAERDVSS